MERQARSADTPHPPRRFRAAVWMILAVLVVAVLIAGAVVLTGTSRSPKGSPDAGSPPRAARPVLAALDSSDPVRIIEILTPGARSLIVDPATLVPPGASVHVLADSWVQKAEEATVLIRLHQPGKSSSRQRAVLVRLSGQWRLLRTEPLT